jgi:hypothetical protein
MLAPVMFRRDAGVTLEIAAEKERIIVPNLLGNLFDRISAFEQTRRCTTQNTRGTRMLQCSATFARSWTKRLRTSSFSVYKARRASTGLLRAKSQSQSRAGNPI